MTTTNNAGCISASRSSLPPSPLLTQIILAILLFLCSFISSPSDTCRLRYSDFHLRFTLPSLVILYGLARPFLAPLDVAKLLVLPALALIWTTPWDNVIVKNKAWSYPASCVLARIGYVPVEEYAFVSARIERWLVAPHFAHQLR